jgi:hypothetical protein
LRPPYFTNGMLRRAMPFQAPGSLTADEVYSVSAYILAEANVVDKHNGARRAVASARADAKPRWLHSRPATGAIQIVISSVTHSAARWQPYSLLRRRLEASAVSCSSERPFVSSRRRANSGTLSSRWFRRLCPKRTPSLARYYRK